MQKNGFTLIEILIVLAVIGLLIAVVALPLNQFRNNQALQNSTNSIISVLNDARAKTLAGLDNTNYSVAVFSNKLVLFKGQTYNSADSTNENYFFDTGITASWSLSGGGNIISFNRLEGSTSQSGTITIQLSSGLTQVVTISNLGTVSRD